MKKSLVAIVVGMAFSAALAQTAPQNTPPAGQSTQPAQSGSQMTPAQPAPAQPPQSSQPMTPAQPAPPQTQPAQPAQPAAIPPCHPAPKKEIKDPAEYNSYTTSLNAKDINAKILGFENFVHLFPNSAYRDEAMEQLMTAYQQAGNNAKMIETAKKLLENYPNNVRALALLAYFARASANQPGANVQQSIAEARNYGERGLQALQNMPCPEGASPADVEKLQKQTSVIFHGAVGFAALQEKNYSAAQQNFQAAVNLEPPTPQDSFLDVYNLALAYLEPKPIDPQGLWYIARAVALSNNNPQVAAYGKAKYVRYHAGEDGWDQLLAQAAAANSNLPPQNFAVAPAPSPAEQAAKLANTVDPKKMDFGQWELILSAGDPATQQKVWSQIKGLEVPFAAKLISGTKTELSVAATSDAIEQNRADVVVTMTGPIPARLMPGPGDTVKVVARPDSYTPNPFVMQMTGGQLIAAPPKAKAAPTHKRTTPKKKTR